MHNQVLNLYISSILCWDDYYSLLKALYSLHQYLKVLKILGAKWLSITNRELKVNKGVKIELHSIAVSIPYPQNNKVLMFL